MSKNPDTIAASTEKVYYSGHYWNDYPLVVKEINKRTTDASGLVWYEHFHQLGKSKRYKKALMINCGNGWLERKMYELGMFSELVGIDFSKELLNEARNNANGLPFRYYQLDTNTGKIPEDGYDLVINLAAVHHIANLDKVFRKISQIMLPDGKFINFDYVGPHRNQYPIQQWAAAWEVNRQLPIHLQQELKYPHLPTMLITDPSEAIHSELTHSTLQRYFDYNHHRQAGGAIAYLLLTHNDNFRKAKPQDMSEWLSFIMKKDGDYLEKTGESMFDYWVATPKKDLPSPEDLESYKNEEQQREEAAVKQGGAYYPPSLIQQLYLQQENDRVKILHLQQTLSESGDLSMRAALRRYGRERAPRQIKSIYRKIRPRRSS